MSRYSAIRFLLITCIVITIQVCSFGQGINKVLVIDTLEGQVNALKIEVHTPLDSSITSKIEILDSLYTHSLLVSNHIVTDVTPDTILNNRHHVYVYMSSTSPSALVKLSLDDSGGVLVLKNVFAIHSDTVRISRLSIFHNCIADTVGRSVHWYKWSGEQLKNVSSKYYPDKPLDKGCQLIYPHAISLTINGSAYIALLQTTRTASRVEWYCNDYKRVSKWRQKMREKRIDKGKPYKYFSGCVTTTKYGLSAVVAIN